MRRYAVLVLALLLAACNLSVPQATPTVAPSLTPSTTPLITFTPSITPTSSITATEIALLPSLTSTATALPTQTASTTSTAIPTLTETPAPTLTPSETPTGTLPPSLTPTDTTTPTPSDTPTSTPTQTVTPSLTPTLTETPTATNTLPPTQTNTPLPPTPSPLPLPTQTPTSTDTPAPTATLPPTQTLTPTIPPRPTETTTPVPSLTSTTPAIAIGPPIVLTPIVQPSSTPPPVTTVAPTLDVTPTFITLAAPSLSIQTPIPATVPPIVAPLPTTLPVGIPTAQIAIIPQVPTGIPLPQTGVGTFAYALSSTGSGVDFSVFSPGFDVDTFAQNPANPNQYAAVNGAGQLFFIGDYANHQTDRVHLDIFTDFTYQVTKREDNDAAVERVIWSPNGQYMAFIIRGGKVNKDGVWYYSPASGGNQILRDCPPQAGCDTTANRGQEGRPAQYQSLNVHWSPDSTALLIELYLPEEGRRAFGISNGLATDPSIMPPVIRYDYANWSGDGQRVVVSGRAPDGQHVVLGTVDRNGVNEQLTDMGALGWSWIQDGIDSGNRFVALGSHNGPDSPQQLVDQNGNALSNPIGGSKPERVDWSPDHKAVLVVTTEGGGRRYWVARVGEQRPREITGQVANALSVEWVGGRLPSSPIVQPQLPVPTAAPVVPGGPAPVGQPATAAPPVASAFTVGQQIQITAPAGLNIRTSRTLTPDSLIALLPLGSTMTVLEGPIDEAGLTWYRVRLDGGQEGWVAAFINGISMAR